MSIHPPGAEVRDVVRRAVAAPLTIAGRSIGLELGCHALWSFGARRGDA